MKTVQQIRKIVGIAMLVCGWAVAVHVLSGFLGLAPEFLGNVLAPCWLLMVPLSLAHALLALAGGADWRERLRRSMVMKFQLAPFFAANFLIGVSGAAAFFLGGLLLTYLAIFISYLALLATSVDVIHALAILRKEERITTFQLVNHVIFQLIYCVDVIDASVLWKNQGKYINPMKWEP